MKIFITCVNASGPVIKLHFQLIEQRAALSEVSNSLRELASKLDSEPPPLLCNLRKGEIICALYQGFWYRAKVFSLPVVVADTRSWADHEQVIVGVHFIDHGNVEEVSLDHTRTLFNVPATNPIRICPDLAHSAVLAGATALGGSWDPDTLTAIRASLLERCFEATVQDTVQGEQVLQLRKVGQDGSLMEDVTNLLALLELVAVVPPDHQRNLLVAMSGLTHAPHEIVGSQRESNSTWRSSVEKGVDVKLPNAQQKVVVNDQEVNSSRDTMTACSMKMKEVFRTQQPRMTLPAEVRNTHENLQRLLISPAPDVNVVSSSGCYHKQSAPSAPALELHQEEAQPEEPSLASSPASTVTSSPLGFQADPPIQPASTRLVTAESPETALYPSTITNEDVLQKEMPKFFDLPPGSVERVRVIYVVSPGEFHVQLIQRDEDRDQLQQQLKTCSRSSLNKTPERGSLLGFFRGGKWLRGKVRSCEELRIHLYNTDEPPTSLKIQMLAIDLGETYELCIQTSEMSKYLAVLPEHLWSEYPALVIRCSLHGLKPMGSYHTWPEACKRKMQSSLSQHPELVMRVEGHRNGGCLPVTLRSLDGASLNYSLTRVGLTEPADIESELPLGPGAVRTRVLVTILETSLDLLRFHVTLASALPRRLVLAKQLEMEGPFLMQVSLRDIHPNMLIAVRSPDDGNWLRARVHSAPPGTSDSKGPVKVRCVDTGRLLDTMKVFRLKPELLRERPFATACQLAARPAGGPNFCEKAMQHLNEMCASGKPLLLTAFTWCKNNSSLVVDLLPSSGSPGLCSTLEGLGLAEPLVNEASISHVDPHAGESCAVFLLSGHASEQLHPVQEELKTSHSKLPLLPVEALREGDLCAVKFDVDGQWCRGKVLHVSESDVQVMCIDYGNVVNTRSVRALPDKLKKDPPPLAQQCNLDMPQSRQMRDQLVKKLQDDTQLWQVVFPRDLLPSPPKVQLLSGGVDIMRLLQGSPLLQMPANLTCKDEGGPQRPAVCISHIDSTERFYIQYIIELPRIENLSHQLMELPEARDSWRRERGRALCAAKNSQDGCWYRALLNGPSASTAIFVDWGFRGTAVSFKPLSSELQGLKPLAVRCCLEPHLKITHQDLLPQMEKILQSSRSGGLQLEKADPHEDNKDNKIMVVRLYKDGLDISQLAAAAGSGGLGDQSVNRVEVTVTHVQSSQLFHVLLGRAACERLEQVREGLADLSILETQVILKPNIRCVARCPKTGELCRGSISKVSNSGEEIRVLLEDTGEEVVVGHVYRLPSGPATELAPLATPCCAPAVPKKLEDHFKQLLNGPEPRRFLAEVGETRAEHSLPLTLFHLNGKAVLDPLLL